MLLLLAVLLAALAALLLSGRDSVMQPIKLPAALLAFGAPALFILVSLLLAPAEATRLRMALLALGLRGGESQALRADVGGGQAEHDVWVSSFARDPETGQHLGSLLFEPSAIEGNPGSLTLELPREVDGGMLVINPQQGSWQVKTASQLADGDELHIGDQVWQVRLEERLLLRDRQALAAADGQSVEIPPRRGEIPIIKAKITIWRPFSVATRTHPLDSLAPQKSGRRLASFLFREPGNGLWLADLDPEVKLVRAGTTIAPPLRALIPSGARVHAVALPLPVPGMEAGGLRDRRSFVVEAGRNSLLLLLDTPEIHSLTSSQIERLIELPSEPGDTTRRVNLAMGDWRVTDRFLHFRHASRLLASEAFATLHLPEDWGPRAVGSTTRIQLVSPHGQRSISAGQPFWLGHNHVAAVQFDLLAPPLALAILGLVLALAKALAAYSGRLSRLQLVAAAAVETLVAVRLLLAYRVWVMPPFADEAFELALVAWAMLPWCLLMASVAPARDPHWHWRDLSQWLPALGGWLFSVAWCWRFGGGGVKTAAWLACHVVALLVPVLRSSEVWHRLWRRSLPEVRLQWSERRWIWTWCGAGMLLGLMRLVLLLLGYRESLHFGARISLSLIHIPVALMLQAGYLVWLWHTSEARGRTRLADLIPALVFAFGTWLGPAMLVSDLGLAMLHLPIFLLAVAALTLAVGRRGSVRAPATWLPAAAVGLLVLVMAFPAVTRGLLAPLPSDLKVRLASERNYLRLLAFAYPEQLRELGRRSSEDLALMTTVLERYTSGEHALTGRGPFASEISPHISDTALREHVPAVFVAAEWGLIGTLGLLLTYLVIALVAPPLAPWGRWHLDRLGTVLSPVAVCGATGYLAALTLALASVYMILANYGVVLFTGRNTYLLGLDSTADVLESFTLLLFLAVGTAAARDEEAA